MLMQKKYIESDMVLLYTPKSLSEMHLCMVKAIGWLIFIRNFRKTREVSAIRANHMEKDDETYALLHVWNLNDYQAILYVKYDSLVMTPSFNFFDYVLPFNNQPPLSTFVTVNRVTSSEFRVDFKTDFIILRPSNMTYNKLLESVNSYANTKNEERHVITDAHKIHNLEYDVYKGLFIRIHFRCNLVFKPSFWKIPPIFAICFCLG